MTTPGFRPTHVVPRDGMPAWDAPDPVRPTMPLDALLPVRLVERQGDWGHVLCANGWSAWVDGRLLVAVPQEPPAAGQPLARTADPRPLLARAEETLGRYRRAVEDLAAGHLDGAAFHARTQGLRVGIVVEGESAWLYEAEHERWVYCDGAQLCTYATTAPPDASAGSAPDAPGPGRPGTAPAARRAADGSEPVEPSEPAASEPRAPLDPPAPSEPPAAGGYTPTQVVPGMGPGPTRAAVGVEPEPTRVVPGVSAEPTQVVRGVGPGSTRVVPGEKPEEPGSGEGGGHAPTRSGDGDG